MPIPERNGLGMFGFAIALVGLIVPSGVVSLLGLILSLAAIGRPPRGFATAGVILGLLGTVFWVLVLLGVLVLGVGAVAVALIAAAGAFVIAQPEVVEITSDMVNLVVATEEYHTEHDALPSELEQLGLSLPAMLDPWGQSYRLAPPPSDRRDYELKFNIVSAGPDRAFGTDDDIALDRLDRVWEQSFVNFEDRMEDFGSRLERLEAAGWHDAPHYPRILEHLSAEDYLRRAVLAAEHEAAEQHGATSENPLSPAPAASGHD